MNGLEEQLNSFDERERLATLEQLATDVLPSVPAHTLNHNMHFHSFFSYNIENWSPARIAWESRKAGLYAAGLCDFDVLDGVQEFLDAGTILSLRTTAAMETRAYMDDYADVEISSPGEPGITYIMGAGFVGRPPPGSRENATLASYRKQATQRNIAVVDRINRHIPDAAIDYETDVMPITPAGLPTERHIIKAYVDRAGKVYRNNVDLARFWSETLRIDAAAVSTLIADRTALEDKARSALVKRGGPGYLKPSCDTFPEIDRFIGWVLSCKAMPTIAWLDGTSDGERDTPALLDYLCSKGAVALNIIPDRNWNVRDARERAVKQANLKTAVETAEELGLAINIGTEMNKPGLPFVDDLDCPALKPYREIFVKGANIVTGHSVLSRYAGFAYTGEKAELEFRRDKQRKNAFFESVGRRPPVNAGQARMLERMGHDKAFDWLTDERRK